MIKFNDKEVSKIEYTDIFNNTYTPIIVNFEDKEGNIKQVFKRTPRSIDYQLFAEEFINNEFSIKNFTTSVVDEGLYYTFQGVSFTPRLSTYVVDPADNWGAYIEVY